MPKPNETAYALKGIPTDIYRRAQAKAAANRPPLSIRWVLITLLEKWVGPAPAVPAAQESTPTPDPKPKGRKAGRKPKPKPQPQPPTVPPTPATSTDLADSF